VGRRPLLVSVLSGQEVPQSESVGIDVKTFWRICRNRGIFVDYIRSSFYDLEDVRKFLREVTNTAIDDMAVIEFVDDPDTSNKWVEVGRKPANFYLSK
jgi:hypothetical protein